MKIQDIRYVREHAGDAIVKYLRFSSVPSLHSVKLELADACDSTPRDLTFDLYVNLHCQYARNGVLDMLTQGVAEVLMVRLLETARTAMLPYFTLSDCVRSVTMVDEPGAYCMRTRGRIRKLRNIQSSADEEQKGKR